MPDSSPRRPSSPQRNLGGTRAQRVITCDRLLECCPTRVAGRRRRHLRSTSGARPLRRTARGHGVLPSSRTIAAENGALQRGCPSDATDIGVDGVVLALRAPEHTADRPCALGEVRLRSTPCCGDPLCVGETGMSASAATPSASWAIRSRKAGQGSAQRRPSHDRYETIWAIEPGGGNSGIARMLSLHSRAGCDRAREAAERVRVHYGQRQARQRGRILEHTRGRRVVGGLASNLVLRRIVPRRAVSFTRVVLLSSTAVPGRARPGMRSSWPTRRVRRAGRSIRNTLTAWARLSPSRGQMFNSEVGHLNWARERSSAGPLRTTSDQASSSPRTRRCARCTPTSPPHWLVSPGGVHASIVHQGRLSSCLGAVRRGLVSPRLTDGLDNPRLGRGLHRGGRGGWRADRLVQRRYYAMAATSRKRTQLALDAWEGRGRVSPNRREGGREAY